MKSKPMNAAAILAAFSLMKQPKSKIAKRELEQFQRILSTIAQFEAGSAPIQLSQHWLADSLGIAKNTAAKYLSALVKKRILLKHESGSRGTIATRYVINRDVYQWREVEWRVPVSHVNTQIAIRVGELKESTERLNFSVFFAPQGRLVAQKVGGFCATTKNGKDNDQGFSVSTSKACGSKTADILSHNDGAEKTPVLYKKKDINIFLSEEKERQLKMIISALMKKTGADYCNGKPKHTLKRLLQMSAGENPAGWFLDQIKQGNPKAGLPALVSNIEAAWPGSPLNPESRTIELEKRKNNILRLISTYEAIDDMEAVGEWKSDLHEIDAELLSLAQVTNFNENEAVEC